MFVLRTKQSIDKKMYTMITQFFIVSHFDWNSFLIKNNSSNFFYQYQEKKEEQRHAQQQQPKYSNFLLFLHINKYSRSFICFGLFTVVYVHQKFQFNHQYTVSADA